MLFAGKHTSPTKRKLVVIKNGATPCAAIFRHEKPVRRLAWALAMDVGCRALLYTNRFAPTTAYFKADPSMLLLTLMQGSS